MNAPSPVVAAGSLVSFTVKINGKPMPDTAQVLAVDTWLAVNRLPRARLVLSDGDPASADFPLSEGKDFVPGNKVVIALGYDGKVTTVFSGVIVRQGIEIDRARGSRLVVELTDDAARMTLARRNAVFENLTDSALITKLIADNGLARDVAATTQVHEAIVQYDATDWDLMRRRAAQNGLVVIVDAGKVRVGAPNTAQAAALTLAYGESILDLDLEMDATGQYATGAIKSATWDVAAQKRIDAGAGSVSVSEPGNLSSTDLAKVFDLKRVEQETGAPIGSPVLQGWSSAALMRSRLGKIRGRVSFPGSALVQVGKVVQLDGLGERFNGKAWVGAVHHHVVDGDWVTAIEIGLPADDEASGGERLAASGLMPPMRGLQTGVVKKVAPDPEGGFRVQLTLPLLNDDGHAVWARLAGFAASNKNGAVFYPEIGDEVVVAFMNEDPRYPVILGSLYSKKRPPPFAPDGKNALKGLVTAGNLAICFDDNDKVIEIRTPGKRVVRLDDKTGSLSLKDAHQNAVTLGRDGITLESGGHLKIKAKGNITVDAGGNLTQQANANVNLDGLQIVLNARAKLVANGAATAELTSGGMLTLRGSLIKIN